MVVALWEALPCLQAEGRSLQGMACMLHKCEIARDADIAVHVHGWLCESGMEAQTTLGNHLVCMLVEAGSMGLAHQLFHRLTFRTHSSWSCLITALAKWGHIHHALSLYNLMGNVDCMPPNGHIIVALLHACANLKDLARGLQIHEEFLDTELLKRDPFVGSALLDMYAKCGLLSKAQEVFDELSNRDVVSWTALIAGYVEHGHGKKALECFEQMQDGSISPDAITYVCGLKACGSINVPEKGQELHADIVRNGILPSNLFVGSALIDMYAKCDLLVKAQEVFNELPVHDVVLWNVLISAYLEKGHDEAALNIFEQMKLQDVSPDNVTFIHIIKACSKLGLIDKGQEMHVEAARKGLLERHILVGSTLIDMYTKCGSLTKAHEVFTKLSFRDSVSWNILIVGYAEHGHDKEALEYFEKLHLEGLSPDVVTYTASLKSCGSLGATNRGQKIHAEIVRNGLLESHVLVGNSLVDMYAECGLLSKAQQVFDDLPFRDVVTWNALITGYVKHERFEEALECHVRMHSDGVCPDVITFIYSLKVCTNLEALEKGQELHGELERLGLVTGHFSIGSTLVDMYAKCGSLAKAQEVFNNIPVRDVVLWNSLITGYAEHGCSEVALTNFAQMQLAGCSPSPVTVIGILKACCNVGALLRGQEIHAEIITKGLVEGDLIVGNTLVDMYAKSGSPAAAQQVFDKLPVHDITSWNALITGYAQLGKCEKVFSMFDEMVEEGIRPDSITFVIVLSACSRLCLIEKCQEYFEAMSKGFGIVPMFEHHICMIDSLSRAGELERAVTIIKKMPFCPNIVIWHSILEACKNWGNLELGKQAFEQATTQNEKDAAAYALMSCIYASANLVKEIPNHRRAKML